MPKKHRSTSRRPDNRRAESRPSRLRIVGGHLRGRSFQYDGNPATRPMKDRVREAVFNLIGPHVEGKLAVDLFAGTGAMAFEALSRGAAQALIIERRFPAARLIDENAAALGLQDRADVIPGDAFVWTRRLYELQHRPWLVFVCPPYDMFVASRDAMLRLIAQTVQQAPPESVVVVESDARFDTAQLPQPDAWDVRPYPPAVVAVHRTGPP